MIGLLRRLPVPDRVAAAYAFVYFACLGVNAAGIRVPVFLDVAFYPLGLVVAWANWRNSQVEGLDPRTRLAWRLLAAAAVTLWASGSVWTLWMTLVGPGLMATLIDRAAFIQYCLAIAGYLCFPARPASPRERWRYVLDVALLIVAGFVIAFYLGLRLLLHDPAQTMLVHAVESSFDWALFVVAAIGCTRKRDPIARRVLFLLLCANIVSMAGNFVLAVVPAYANGHPVDGLWFAAWVLRWTAARMAALRYAGARPGAREPGRPESEYRSNPFSYVLVGGVFVLLIAQFFADDRRLLPMLAIAAMVMGVLLVLRQFAELEGNRRLLRTQGERESRFTSLVAKSSDVVIVVDGTGLVTYVSPAHARVFGTDARMAPGVRLQDLLTPDDAKGVSDILASGATGPARFNARVQLVSGHWREIESVWRDLRDDPAVNGIVINCRDVTDRREAERRLRHAQKLDAMGHLAGGLAHDLNNVLAVIRGYSELLQSDLREGSPAAADLDQIMKAVDRATSVIQKVLAFSRKQPGRRAVIDVNDVVRELRPMLGHLVKDHVDVRLTLGPGLWPVRADQGQLEQVLVNLATNARDAMPDGGVLHITTANRTIVANPESPLTLSPGDYVAVVVRDHGTGMSPTVLSHIFEPFFSTKPQGRGIGLGLAIVHGIVTDHDGGVLVDSAEGRGTAITCLLPRAPASATAPA